jgi:hypothetical protein
MTPLMRNWIEEEEALKRDDSDMKYGHGRGKVRNLFSSIFNN